MYWNGQQSLTASIEHAVNNQNTGLIPSIIAQLGHFYASSYAWHETEWFVLIKRVTPNVPQTRALDLLHCDALTQRQVWALISGNSLLEDNIHNYLATLPVCGLWAIYFKKAQTLIHF
jgi:hypothetical protein